MADKLRYTLLLLGALLFSPVFFVDGSGNQPGLGFYFAFIGIPLGSLLLAIGVGLLKPDGYARDGLPPE
jgi:hypothetical protein